MTQVIADQKDMEFILYEQFNAEKLLNYEKYKGFSKKIFDMILFEARKVGIKEILPTLADGDKQGVRFENGKVAVPDSFHRARQVVREADLRRVVGNIWRLSSESIRIVPFAVETSTI